MQIVDKKRRERPPFEPAAPVVITAADSARLAAEGRELRKDIRERIASMEVVLPAGHPVKAR